jgi:hypothetical protein
MVVRVRPACVGEGRYFVRVPPGVARSCWGAQRGTWRVGGWLMCMHVGPLPVCRAQVAHASSAESIHLSRYPGSSPLPPPSRFLCPSHFPSPSPSPSPSLNLTLPSPPRSPPLPLGTNASFFAADEPEEVEEEQLEMNPAVDEQTEELRTDAFMEVGLGGGCQGA